MIKYFTVLLMLVFLIGCSSGSNYKLIEGTSEEFSKDVYNLLEEFKKEMKEPIGRTTVRAVASDIYKGENTPVLTFWSKYNERILNKREQEIFKIINSAIGDCDSYKGDFNDYEYKQIVKKGAEIIYLEIE